eukprot:GEMP01031122.1.p1 GENE.GEMP01031122.1~~GEMP01031122.1.p1  ORF type:complete len:370 (+),score=113.17 GEMP01031122.1:44-1153(+)
MDHQWIELKGKLEKAMRSSVSADVLVDLLADLDEYVERLGLQNNRLEEHLKASEAEIKSLKAATTTMERLVQEVVKGEDSLGGKLSFHTAAAPSKHSVEELVEQLARAKQENDDLVKQKIANEKFYNAEIEKLCRFKATIQAHTEALSMDVKVEAESVRRERDDLLFQNADDELSKGKMKTRLDDAVQQLRQLAELTEEQAKGIEWLKVHRPDETEGRPAILDHSKSSDTGSQLDAPNAPIFALKLELKADVDEALAHHPTPTLREKSASIEAQNAAKEPSRIVPGVTEESPRKTEASESHNSNLPIDTSGRMQNPRTSKGRKYVPEAPHAQQGTSQDSYAYIEPSSPTQLAQQSQHTGLSPSARAAKT